MFAFVYLTLALRTIPDSVRFTFYSIHYQYSTGPRAMPWPLMFAGTLMLHLFYGALMVLPMLYTGTYWRWATNADCKKFVLGGHADAADKDK